MRPRRSRRSVFSAAATLAAVLCVGCAAGRATDGGADVGADPPAEPAERAEPREPEGPGGGGEVAEPAGPDSIGRGGRDAADPEAQPAEALPIRPPAPLTGLDVEVPERLYAGSSVPARIRVRTAFGPRATVPSVTWRSSDPEVLTVSRHGTIKAVAPGHARLEASVDGVDASVDIVVVGNPVRRLDVLPPSAEVRVGEPIHLSAVAYDAGGGEVDGAHVTWTVAPSRPGMESAAAVDPDGTFVANTAGVFHVAAVFAGLGAAAELHARPRPPRRPSTVVAHRSAPVGAELASLRVFEAVDARDYAYTGTRGRARLYVWDVTDRADPALLDSVPLPGRHVTDVAIDEAATIGVVAIGEAGSGEAGMEDAAGGDVAGGALFVLDILDPARPRPIAAVGERGARGAWIEGDLVYVARAGTEDLRILDISEPARPREVGSWKLGAPARRLHDVTVRDGLAYLAHGPDGLVVLDVGAGIAGGTPSRPRMVSQFIRRHRWGDAVYADTRGVVRDRNRVFVAEEIVGCEECAGEPRGHVHVVDVADVEHPRGIAHYRLPGAGAPKLWMSDDVLYVGYEGAGVRIVDVSGELRGDLWRQGREIGRIVAGDREGKENAAAAAAAAADVTAAGSVQFYEGLLFGVDRRVGLLVLRPGGAQ